jgi:UDP-glucose 4-epimerase
MTEEMNKVFVIGGAGFIGSHTADTTFGLLFPSRNVEDSISARSEKFTK